MLQLRFSRFCSLQPFPILQGRRYKWNKVVGFRTLHTVKMDLTKTQAIQQNQQPLLYQNVIVMRHGERMDNFDPLWSSTAARPWDPPLAPPGLIQAFETGRTIQKDIGFPIHRIVVSPFLRCIQTAAELVAGLFAVDDSHDTFYVSIDPSKVKVSIEYGVCEMMNSIAIRLNVFPKDGIFSFDIAEREAMLPPGTVDNDVEMVYKESYLSGKSQSWKQGLDINKQLRTLQINMLLRTCSLLHMRKEFKWLVVQSKWMLCIKKWSIVDM